MTTLEDLDSSMKQAIKSGNNVELKSLLLRSSPPSSRVVDCAVDRLARRPHSMKRRRAINILLDHGWDVNLKLGMNDDPMLSMFVEHPKLVRWLIEKGANPSVVSPSGDTPLSFAVTTSSVKTIKRLISANKTFGQDLGTGDLVYRAVRRCGKEQNLDILNLLIRAGAPVDDIIWDKPPAYHTKQHLRRGGPLHEAVKYGYTDVASVLIANGADPHKQKMRYRRMVGDTPHEIATKNGNTAMLELMQRL